MSILVFTLGVLSLLMVGLTLSSTYSRAGSLPDENEQRIAGILAQMTLEEKIDYLGGVNRFYTRAVPRLGIPGFKMADGPLGIRNDGPSTAFAAGIALAASWDADLARRVGTEIGRDARARGVHFLLGPGVNIYREPMNGRNFEYFGEDPFLASAITVGYVEGVQSQGVSATVKHFLGNNSEFDRRRTDAVIDERALREIYLPAFEAAVKEARVGSIMTSYNRTNGAYMSQNGPLNNDIVKKEWGFDGVVMSDWTSTFDGIAAANGGLDLEMPAGDFLNRDTLLPALKSGLVSEATIDDKVRRILRTAVRFGWLDREQTDYAISRYNTEGDSVALDAARGSMVLLKNDPELLPLDSAQIKSIAVVGPNAHPAVAVGGGSARVVPFHAVSFLEGLRAEYKDVSNVLYHPGIPTAAEIAEATHFMVAPTGMTDGMEMEVFPNMELSGEPAQTIVESRVGEGEKTRGIPEPFTSVRWTGYYAAPEAGEYDIFVQIPGEQTGYRLYMDDRLILDAWEFSKALMDQTAVNLIGATHKVVLELVRRGAGFYGGKLRLGIAPAAGIVSRDAIALAARSDAVVVAVGFDPDSESESGDRTFALPIGQDALIKDIAAANKKTIVVITSGGGVDMSRWIDTVPAVIQAWYPGQEGGTALAEILTGAVNPSGRLPVTFEARQEDNPAFRNYYPAPGSDRVEYAEGVFVGYRGYEHNAVKPLFPFGHGLSYTEFQYSDLDIVPLATVDATGEPAGPGYEVSFDIRNTGDRAGAEVAQLYVGSAGEETQRPPKELKGFRKIFLAPDEKKRITFQLDRRDFCYYDPQRKGWEIEPGEREILVGSSSEQIELKAVIDVTVFERPEPGTR